jgi:PKD repeat protein
VTDDDGALNSTSATKTVLNRFPVANFTYSPLNPLANSSVTFDASTSYDPDGFVFSYFWDFDDGTNATGEIVTHAFTQGRIHLVTLTVTDDDGETGSTAITVPVSTAPTTLVLRPNASGDFTQWSPSYGVPNWQCIDEDVQNGDVDYVYADTKELVDSYNLQNTTQTGNISSVRVSVYARQTTGNEVLRQFLLIDGVKYYGAVDHIASFTYTLFYNDWATNPATGLPWTWSDINSLETGFESVQGGPKFKGTVIVTQLYVEVTYVPAGTIPGDIDGDGDVDAIDFGFFAFAYGSSVGDPRYVPEADLDGDGDIDAYDFGTFASNYGTSI